MWKLIKRHVGNVYRSYLRFEDDDGWLMAAAVAYYLGLSLFPLLLVVIAGVGIFFKYSAEGEDAQQYVIKVVGEHVSENVAEQVDEMLAQVRDRSTLGGPIGLATILVAAIAGFTQFERAFDRMWKVPEHPPAGILGSIKHTLIERGVAFVMLLVLGVLVVVVFFASIALSVVDQFTESLLQGINVPAPPLRSLMTLTLNAVLFMLLYRWLPRRPVKWGEALHGAVFTAIGWEIGRQVLSSYVIGGKYSSAYGIVGSFIAILLWCYYAVAVIFLGGEYIQETCADCEPKRPPAKPGSNGSPVAAVPNKASAEKE